jgi:hypothetical protein
MNSQLQNKEGHKFIHLYTLVGNQVDGPPMEIFSTGFRYHLIAFLALGLVEARGLLSLRVTH